MSRSARKDSSPLVVLRKSLSCYSACFLIVLCHIGTARAEISVLTAEELAAIEALERAEAAQTSGGPSVESNDDPNGEAEAAQASGGPSVESNDDPNGEAESVGEQVPAFEHVVRATRPARAVSDFRIDVADRPVSSRSHMTSVLRLAPGLHLSQHSGEGKADQLFLRGFDAIHGQDIEVVVGGIPINEPSNIHGQGYADLHFIIPELVMAMRALEGTYDLRQGDFAVAGSLRLDLGLVERGILLRGDYGRFNSWRTLAAWGPRSQPDETFVAFDYEAGDGFGPSRAWNRVRAMGQALIDLPSSWDIRLLATSYVGRFDSAGVVRLDDLESGAMGFYETYDPHQGGFSSRHQGLAEVRYLGDDDRAALAVFGGFRDLRLRHDFTGFTFETPAVPGEDVSRPGDLAEQLHQMVDLGMTASYRRLALPFRWLRYVEVGLSVRHSRIEQSQRRLRSVDRQPWLDEIDAELQVTSIGAYLDLELRPIRWLALRGGIRLDTMSALIFDELGYDGLGSRRDAMGVQPSPRVTLEVQPTDAVTLFGSYGRGLRSPQALSLGDGEEAPLTTIDSGELGLSLVRAGVGELRLAGFCTYIEEDLIFDHVSGRNIFTGETVRGGIAVALTHEVTSWLRVNGNLTWTRAVYIDSGELVPYAPPLVARADLIAGGPVGRLWQRELRLEGVVSLSVVGPRPLPYDEQSQSMALVDASVSARLGEVEVGVSLRNLTNVEWRDGEFVYVSSFDGDVVDPSLVPARHMTAGYPLTVMGFLALHL